MIDHLHRGMTHTAESLAALSDRELDALVAELVFGKIVIRSSGDETHESFVREDGKLRQPLRYSTTWVGMGDMIERMLQFGLSVETYSINSRSFSSRECVIEDPQRGTGTDYEKSHLPYGFGHADSLPKAVAIAAILAIQSINKPQP
jgi:hypothetical protein